MVREAVLKMEADLALLRQRVTDESSIDASIAEQAAAELRGIREAIDIIEHILELRASREA